MLDFYLLVLPALSPHHESHPSTRRQNTCECLQKSWMRSRQHHWPALWTRRPSLYQHLQRSEYGLVGWLEFNVPFQHKYRYIRDERSGVDSYPLTQWRKACDIVTSTLAAFLFSRHTKRERDQEAHLNYYASADNYRTARLNKTYYNKTPKKFQLT